MHAAGKTDEARADLARLALVRKKREEAAKKKEEETKGMCHFSVSALCTMIGKFCCRVFFFYLFSFLPSSELH